MLQCLDREGGVPGENPFCRATIGVLAQLLLCEYTVVCIPSCSMGYPRAGGDRAVPLAWGENPCVPNARRRLGHERARDLLLKFYVCNSTAVLSCEKFVSTY